MCSPDSPSPNNSTPGVGSFPGFIGGGASDSIDNSQQAVLSYIHIFTPSLVNEARFGFIRHNGSSFGNTGARPRLRRGA